MTNLIKLNNILFLAIVMSKLSLDLMALKVTRPTEGDEWVGGEPFLVQWESVSTDAQYFNIELVNNNPSTYATGFTKEIKTNQATSANSYQLESLEGLKSGVGYQINLVSPVNHGILAQSSPFSVISTGGNAPPSIAPNVTSSAPANYSMSITNPANSSLPAIDSTSAGPPSTSEPSSTDSPSSGSTDATTSGSANAPSVGPADSTSNSTSGTSSNLIAPGIWSVFGLALGSLAI